MQLVSSIARSGMTAASVHMDTAAHNIANLQTEGYRRSVATAEIQMGGGVVARVGKAPATGQALEADVVGLMAARQAFGVNMSVFRASDTMAGALLDMLA